MSEQGELRIYERYIGLDGQERVGFVDQQGRVHHFDVEALTPELSSARSSCSEGKMADLEFSMRGEALDQLREAFTQLPPEALMATIEDVCRERDEAEARAERLHRALEELWAQWQMKHAALNAVRGLLEEVLGDDAKRTGAYCQLLTALVQPSDIAGPLLGTKQRRRGNDHRN